MKSIIFSIIFGLILDLLVLALGKKSSFVMKHTNLISILIPVVLYLVIVLFIE